MLPNPPEGLRHWQADDAPALAAAWSDPAIIRWNPPPSGLDAAAWIAGAETRWARRLSLDLVIGPGVAGEVGLAAFTDAPTRAELGVWVAADRRGSGVASRAVTTVTDWAFAELGVEQLWARTDPANAAAESLFARVGWSPLGESAGKTIWSVTPSLLR